MDGSAQTGLTTCTEVTLRADDLEGRMYPDQVRAVLWALSRSRGLPLPDALFHHAPNGAGSLTTKPTILWHPTSSGVSITAVGESARATLLGAIPVVVQLLTEATKQRISIGVEPSQQVVIAPSHSLRRYSATHVVVTRKKRQITRWEAADEAERHGILRAIIAHSITDEAEAWGLSAPALPPDAIQILSVGAMRHGATVTRDRARKGKRIIGSTLEQVVFAARLELKGPWSIGALPSKGFGRIRLMGRKR